MIGFRLLAACFCLIGVVWLGWLYSQTSLPLVQAEVLEAAVTQTERGDHRGSFIMRYEFGGETREVRLDTPLVTSSLALAQREVDQLPVGSTLELPVDPQHPEQLNWPAFGKGGRLFVPLVFLALGFCFWAIPEGIIVILDRKTPIAKVVFYSFGSIGLLLFSLGLASLSAPYDVWKSWPRVEAQVEKSELVGAGKTRGMRLACRYEVDGKEVTGTLYSSWKIGRQNAQAWLDQYPAGRPLTVRYYPKDPRICRHDLGFSSFLLTLALLGGGALFGLLGLVIGKMAR